MVFEDQVMPVGELDGWHFAEIQTWWSPGLLSFLCIKDGPDLAKPHYLVDYPLKS